MWIIEKGYVEKIGQAALKDPTLKVSQRFDESPKVAHIQEQILLDAEPYIPAHPSQQLRMLAINRIAVHITKELDSLLVETQPTVFQVCCPCAGKPHPLPGNALITERRPFKRAFKAGEGPDKLVDSPHNVKILRLHAVRVDPPTERKVDFRPLSEKTCKDLVHKLRLQRQSLWKWEPLDEKEWKGSRPPIFDDDKFLQGPPSVTTGHPAFAEGVAIASDGNCLFRAILYHLIGHQDLHTDLRKLACWYIEKMEADHDFWYQRHKFKGPAYIAQSDMRRSGTWSTDYEMHALGKIMNVDIYVFSLDLTRKTDAWHRWPAGSGKIFTEEAIYLVHVNGNHYEVVLAP